MAKSAGRVPLMKRRTMATIVTTVFDSFALSMLYVVRRALQHNYLLNQRIFQRMKDFLDMGIFIIKRIRK